jgi:hypothetical protein
MQEDNQISIPEKIVATTNTIREKPNEEIREKLILLINELINTDFNALVQLLYRIDVNELKLKQLLEARPDTEAASIIADLIISRQLQKIATRKGDNNREDQDTDESW